MDEQQQQQQQQQQEPPPTPVAQQSSPGPKEMDENTRPNINSASSPTVSTLSSSSSSAIKRSKMKLFKTPSPNVKRLDASQTVETAAMTPLTIHSVSSQPGKAPTRAPSPRVEIGYLHQGTGTNDGNVGVVVDDEDDEDDLQEWRIRALFRDEDVRQRPYRSSSPPSMPLHPRSDVMKRSFVSTVDEPYNNNAVVSEQRRRRGGGPPTVVNMYSTPSQTSSTSSSPYRDVDKKLRRRRKDESLVALLRVYKVRNSILTAMMLGLVACMAIMIFKQQEAREQIKTRHRTVLELNLLREAERLHRERSYPSRAAGGLRSILVPHVLQRKKDVSAAEARHESYPKENDDHHQHHRHHHDEHHHHHDDAHHHHQHQHHEEAKLNEGRRMGSSNSFTEEGKANFFKRDFVPVRRESKPILFDISLIHDEEDENSNSNDLPHPRIVAIGHSTDLLDRPSPRRMVLYPTEYTDPTQLYGVLDSDDEEVVSMERREPLEQGECVPMQEWQTTYHPLCNGMHELGLDHMGRLTGDDFRIFGTKGYWRNAWRVDSLGTIDAQSPSSPSPLVLKTLKFEHNFEDAHFEHDRIDAVAMERLTKSPHVINVFGFCGHSVLTEFADGTRVGELADKSKKKPLVRLKIARDIATGLADVHGIDGDGNATFVHLDINPANVMSIGGTLKLNDFNIGILLRWNTTSNTHCGFPAQYPNPQWRSPEEARNEQNLTEKVDVFSMGHIFFRLICGHEPWNKLEPGGKPTKEEINEKVQRGVLPFIPDDIRNTTNAEVAAIRDAMLRCYTFDPTERPTARSIAQELDASLGKLSVVQERS